MKTLSLILLAIFFVFVSFVEEIIALREDGFMRQDN